jgi:hypothetical protein
VCFSLSFSSFSHSLFTHDFFVFLKTFHNHTRTLLNKWLRTILFFNQKQLSWKNEVEWIFFFLCAQIYFLREITRLKKWRKKKCWRRKQWVILKWQLDSDRVKLEKHGEFFFLSCWMLWRVFNCHLKVKGINFTIQIKSSTRDDDEFQWSSHKLMTFYEEDDDEETFNIKHFFFCCWWVFE